MIQDIIVLALSGDGAAAAGLDAAERVGSRHATHAAFEDTSGAGSSRRRRRARDAASRRVLHEGRQPRRPLAGPWAGLATAYRHLPIGGDVPQSRPSVPNARRTSPRLDPDHEKGTRRWERGVLVPVGLPLSQRLLRRGLDLQPSSPTYSSSCPRHSNLGRHEEALEGIRRARVFDPDCWCRGLRVVASPLHGEALPESLERLDALVAVEPGFATGHVMRMYPLLCLGPYDEAVRPTIALWRCGASSARARSSLLGRRIARLCARAQRRTAEAERILTSFPRTRAGTTCRLTRKPWFCTVLAAIATAGKLQAVIDRDQGDLPRVDPSGTVCTPARSRTFWLASPARGFAAPCLTMHFRLKLFDA